MQSYSDASSAEDKPVVRWLSVVLLGLMALAFIYADVVVSAGRIRLKTDGVDVVGTVVNKWTNVHKGRYTYLVSYRFLPNNGTFRHWRGFSHTSQIGFNSVQIGSPIPLTYVRNNPSIHDVDFDRIAHTREIFDGGFWLVLLCGLFFGVLSCLLGCAPFLQNLRVERRA